MTPTFYILDHPALPTPYNHRFFVEKFARGFTHHGHDVRRVERLSEISEPGLVMVSGHDWFHHVEPRRGIGPAATMLKERSRLLARLGERAKRRVVERLAERVAGRGIVVLAWFWSGEADWLRGLGMPLIFTGERHYEQPASEYHAAWRSFYESSDDALPITFSADADPRRIGDGSENERYGVVFVGQGLYKPDWYGTFAEGDGNRIVPTPPYIDEDERLDIYRNAKVVLGLHSDDNIANAVVVERVFEALAYGAVCVTDNPHGAPATGGVARVAATREEMESVVQGVLDDDSRRRELREAGFEFARTRGTYAHRAEEFIAARARMLGEG